MCYFIFFFFFSSRRRHTRSKRDWSSDVCASDLPTPRNLRREASRTMPQTGHDQTGIWTSPLRVSPRDAFWLVPFAAGTAVALHYDAQAQQNLGIDKSRIDTSNIISGFGSPYATLGGTAGLYFLGLGTHMSALPKQGVWERRRSSIL